MSTFWLCSKSHLDETLKKAHIEVTSSKIWDHERAYEKRVRLPSITLRDFPTNH
jgi:hypothetical protein